MTKFNWDKVHQQRRDKRKSVRVDTWKKAHKQDRNSLWHSAIQKSTVFLSGKYIHKEIGTILKTDPKYCIWCIDNQPQGIVARQILRHYNR